jgi:2',3'-cyclic-nucleotide 2'-phosphodiesterase
MRILFIGDIVGKPGRKAVRLLLPRLRERYQPDVIIANGENMVGGSGINRDTADEMFKLGIAALTTGNHAFHQRESPDLFKVEPRILRPLNFPPGTPGNGCIELDIKGTRLVVVCIQGRVFLPPLDDPFRAIDTLLADLGDPAHVFVDFHAEATAEKGAFGLYVDGRVSAVVGTHTHVPTADARVLPKGTAFITDVGMAGPRESVIGMDSDPVIKRFQTQMFHRYQVAGGAVDLNAVVVELAENGQAEDITLVQEVLPA